MISVVDMNEVKRKVSSAYFEDGLWDILLGVFIIMLSVPYSLLIPLLGYCVGYFVLKRIRHKVTYPRAGYMKINGNRRLAIMPLLGIFIFIGFLLLNYLEYIVVSYYSTSSSWWTGWLQMLPAVALPSVVAFVAYYFKVKRWYWYAILSLLSFIIAGWFWSNSMRSSMFYTFVGPGAIVILAGMIIFVRFIRNNPKMVVEELDEQTQNG